MIIATCGNGSSGASAVLDFLRGYDELQFVPFEFQLLHQADGICDLKYHLTQSRERVACNAAIQRFRKVMYQSRPGFRIRRIVGPEYEKIVESYVSKLVLAEWKGRSAFDPVDLSDKCTNAITYKRQLYTSHILRKINKILNIPPFKTRYFSILDEETFDKATAQFLTELFSAAGYNLNNDLVLDMLLSAQNPGQGMEFFPDVKAIVIIRDPRDTYIRTQVSVFLNSFIPRDSVENFCVYYRNVMSKAILNSRTLVVQYEDLIYQYEETKKKIMDFLGYEKNPAREFQYFNPNISVKYTNLAPKYPQYKDDIRYIEKELSEYLYDFKDYVPLKIDSEYKGAF